MGKQATGVSGDKLNGSVVAMGLSESLVARDERRRESLGERDVHPVGHRVGVPQLVGTLDEGLRRPTPNRQTLEVGNGDQSFVVADQPADDRAAERADHFHVEMRRGVHRLAAQASGDRGPGTQLAIFWRNRGRCHQHRHLHQRVAQHRSPTLTGSHRVTGQGTGSGSLFDGEQGVVDVTEPLGRNLAGEDGQKAGG